MNREIQLNELKEIELNILKQIHEVCVAQEIRYFLAGGTLLGAIRHKGFIPWDDDIDIAMPRPDYEKFVDYCLSHETPFKLVCSKADSKYGYLFAKAMDMNTVLIEKYGNKYGIEMGVYVDIFPIDGLGDTIDGAIKNLNKTRFLRELLVAANWKKFFRSKTRAAYYEPIRFAFFCIARSVSFKKTIKRIESKYKSYSFDECKYVGCVCGSYRNKEVIEREVFSEYIDIEFEGFYFKGLKDYDKYLSNIYGDYMQLPPEEKRVTHHIFDAYYKNI